MFLEILRQPSTRNPLIIVLMSSLLVLSFQNCSKAEFDNGGNIDTSNNGNGFSDPTSDPPDDESEKIVKNCAKLKASGNLLEIKKTVSFEDTKIETGRNQVCLFGQDGNLSMLNTFQRARYEQIRNIDLPANAELCDLDIDMDTQTLRYDDMFYLTLNEVVIASNAGDVVQNLDGNNISVGPQSVNNFLYDWSNIAGSPFDNDGNKDYCLGAQQGLSSCQWPATEVSGDFIFSYSPELLIHLGARSNTSRHQLMFSITGDNDPNHDCYHEAFQFEVTAKYYVK